VTRQIVSGFAVIETLVVLVIVTIIASGIYLTTRTTTNLNQTNNPSTQELTPSPMHMVEIIIYSTPTPLPNPNRKPKPNPDEISPLPSNTPITVLGLDNTFPAITNSEFILGLD